MKIFDKKCGDCARLLKMVSHPCTDGEPMSHKIGYACGVFLCDGIVVPNWNPDFTQCEMWEEKCKYRYLDIGEIVACGDEYFSKSKKVWETTGDAGMENIGYFKYRRKINE